MALLDRMVGVPPTQREWVRRADSALRADPRVFSGYFDHHAFELGIEPDFVTRNRITPPLGVHAVALVARHGRWQPALLVMREMAPDSPLSNPTPASEFAHMRAMISEVGDRDPQDVFVIGIDPPRDQYESVRGDLVGTLGLPVRLENGSPGVLTAGHVARTVGSQVLIGDGVTGEVVFSDHRARYTGGTPCADVAAIRLDASWRTRVDVPLGLSVGATTKLKTLDPLNRSGIGRGGQIVRTVGDRFFVNETEGSWGDFIMVDPISVEGDSGSLALSNQGRVAGQVVGGLSGAYSIVQDLEYLTEAAQVTADLPVTQH